MALYSVHSARNGARHILTLRFCAADEEIRRGIVSGVSVRQLEEIDHTVSGVVFRAWSKEDNLLYRDDLQYLVGRPVTRERNGETVV